MFVIVAHNVMYSILIYIHRFIYRPIDFAIHLKNALKTLLQNIVLIILLRLLKVQIILLIINLHQAEKGV